LYTPEWPDLDLEYMKIFAASFGGPIAAYREIMKGNTKPIIQILDTAGRLLSRIIVSEKRNIFKTFMIYLLFKVESWKTDHNGMVGYRGIDLCTR